MRFKGLDLNLLVALNALLEERSVTAAARRMHLSQPAMSSALARLREHLGDELLVPIGKRMVPTAHADQLHHSIQMLLSQIEQVVSLSRVCDPATTTREFHIIASDYSIEVLMGSVIRQLAISAPKLKIVVHSPSQRTTQAFLQGAIDLIITPRSYLLDDHPAELLFEDRQVLVGWNGNPLMSCPITQEEFYSAGHIVAEFGEERVLAFAEQHMRGLSPLRRIEVVLPSFTSCLGAVVGTNRLTVIHERLARSQARYLPLSIAEVPIELPKFEEFLQHHGTRRRDDGLIWLRGVIRYAATVMAG